MNIYEKLINYLKEKIIEIDAKTSEINEHNLQVSRFKEYVSRVISQIDSKNLESINVEELKDMVSTVDSELAAYVHQIITDCKESSEYLFDDTFDDPIKDECLEELETVRNRLNTMLEDMQLQEIDANDIENRDKYESCLELVNGNGYTKVLTPEEYDELTNIVKGLEVEDALELIREYIKYAVSMRAMAQVTLEPTEEPTPVQEPEVREEPIRVPEPEIIPVEQSEPVEVAPVIVENPRPVQTEMLPEDRAMLMTLVEMYGSVYPEEEYEDGNIDDYLENRGEYISNFDIDWSKVIPIIKSMLSTPYATKMEQLIGILRTITNETNEINIYIENQEREREEAERRRLAEEAAERERLAQEAERNRLLRENEELDAVNNESMATNIQKLTELKEDIATIENKLKMLNIDIEKLKNYIKTSDKDNYYAYIKGSNLTSEEKELYYNYQVLVFMLRDCSEKQEGMASETTADKRIWLIEIKDQLERISAKIEELKPLEKAEKAPELPKQYQIGLTTIIFFRPDKNSQFLIETDTAKENGEHLTQFVDKTNEILDRVTRINYNNLNKGHSQKGFRAPIANDVASEGDELFFDIDSPVPTLTTDRTPYRLNRFSMHDNARISYISLNISNALKEKLGCNSNNVVLIVGIVYKEDNRKKEAYGKLKNEVLYNRSEIKRILKLLKQDEPTDELLKLLDDSSKLFYKLCPKSAEANRPDEARGVALTRRRKGGSNNE